MADTPQRIGKYKIITRLATGGMGSVFKAQHPTLNQELVIKKLTMQDSAHLRERFRREAQIMFGFKSDYIVDVYDHFREGSAYHIVQEYIDGISLEDLIERERYLPEHIALRIMLYAARALKYAHTRKVVHRDIKPGNILISSGGSVKLVDFGIASIRDQVNDEELTQIGMTLGTPSYMAPEQFTSSRDVDKRADIYSLGVMLYEMLTGKKPFPGTKLPETYQRIIKGKYKNPRRHNPNISRSTLRLIRKTMQPKLKRRYQDMGKVIRFLEKQLRIRPMIGVPFEFADMLAAFVAGERTNPPRSRIHYGKIAAAVIACGLGAAGLWQLYSNGYHQRLINPGLYGSVTLQITTGMEFGDFNDLPRKVQLVSSRNPSEEPLVLDVNPPLRNHFLLQLLPEQIRPEALENTLVSQTRFLRSGTYHLEASIGTQRYQQSVFVHSYQRQFDGPGDQNYNTFRLQHTVPDPIPLRVQSIVRDQLNGNNITPVSRIEAMHDGRFQPLTDLLEREALYSGTSTHFRISRRGYYSQELKLSSQPDQPDLFLQAALVPRSGEIILTTNDPDARLRINNSSTYIAGGPEPRSSTIPPLDPEAPVEIRLPPGRYTLQAAHGRRLGDEIGIQINSEQTRYFHIESRPEDDILTIDVTQQGESL